MGKTVKWIEIKTSYIRNFSREFVFKYIYYVKEKIILFHQILETFKFEISKIGFLSI